MTGANAGLLILIGGLLVFTVAALWAPIRRPRRDRQR